MKRSHALIIFSILWFVWAAFRLTAATNEIDPLDDIKEFETAPAKTIRPGSNGLLELWESGAIRAQIERNMHYMQDPVPWGTPLEVPEPVYPDGWIDGRPAWLAGDEEILQFSIRRGEGDFSEQYRSPQVRESDLKYYTGPGKPKYAIPLGGFAYASDGSSYVVQRMKSNVVYFWTLLVPKSKDPFKASRIDTWVRRITGVGIPREDPYYSVLPPTIGGFTPMYEPGYWHVSVEAIAGISGTNCEGCISYFLWVADGDAKVKRDYYGRPIGSVGNPQGYSISHYDDGYRRSH